MRNILLVIFASALITSCMHKPQEGWTGHKEHKPHAGKNNAGSYIHKN